MFIAPDSGTLELAVNATLPCAGVDPFCEGSCDDMSTGELMVMAGTR